MSDFFDTHTGTAAPLLRRNKVWRRVRDWFVDLHLIIGGNRSRIVDNELTVSARVLIVGIEVTGRVADIHRVVESLVKDSRHEVSVSIVPMGDKGKFANIDDAIALASSGLDRFDWLVVADDDILFKPRFLDTFIALASAADLSIAQPAHAYESYTTYQITRRRLGSLVRRTRFVEIGPLTLVKKEAFSELIPFPASRWCYGIDVLWSEIARRNEFKMGIVDGTPVRHLRPVAASYSMDEAAAEGRDLLRQHGVNINRDALFFVDTIVIPAA